jgi:PAS domain S-box-containing protein
VAIRINEALFTPELWRIALEKYATAANLTVQLFDIKARPILGPFHLTPLFELFDPVGYNSRILAKCARECLGRNHNESAVRVIQFHGLSAISASLALEGKLVGAAVGGFVFAEFSQVSEIHSLARDAGITFDVLWAVARKQQPVPERRLVVLGELLQTLGEALLRENFRTRQFQHAAAIINSSGDAIISENLYGVITAWNLGAERLFGYPAAEALGKSITRLLSPPGRPNEERDVLKRIRQGESIVRYETTRRRKDGALLAISLAVSPITNGNGRIVGASKIARDISQQKHAEEALKESQAVLRDVTNEARVGLVMVDDDRKYLFANQTYADILGLPTADIVGQRLPDVLKHLYHLIQPHLDRAMAGERLTHKLHSPAHPQTGDERFYEVTYEPRTGNRGRYVVVVIVDITEKEKAQEILERTVAERTAKLHDAIGDLEAFSYSVAHDLRAPLRAMSGYAEQLLNEPALSLQARNYLQRIVRAAGRLDSLTQDVLTFSQLSRAETKLQPIDLDKLVREVIQQYPEFCPSAPEGKESIEICSPLLPVLGHESFLAQILFNLLSNACKFVAKGVQSKVRIWTDEVEPLSLEENKSDDETHPIPSTLLASSLSLNNPSVKIFVQDNGIGIAPEHRDRLFKIFGRIHPDQKYEGTGIGLAIVKKAAERMGGTVGFQSKPGKGSRFWVQLRKA